jgi:hypothetical protein
MASDKVDAWGTPSRWKALYDACGGQEKLASALLVEVSTLWRWSRGQCMPGLAVQAHVNALCKRHGVRRVFNGAAK